MRRVVILVIDLFLVAVATVLALLLRDNFMVSNERFVALGPYLLLSLAVAAVVFPALKINRSIWCFTGISDYLRILFATFATVMGAVVLSFGLNRLDGVTRVLPLLQGLLILSALVGVRVCERLRLLARHRPARDSIETLADNAATLLVVGLGRLTSMYLRSVAEFGRDSVKVAGLLGNGEHQSGRSVQGYPILGTTEQIATVLRDLEVHGVLVDRVVVATPFEKLSPAARDALLDVERRTEIRVDFLAERLGFEPGPRRRPATPSDPPSRRDETAVSSVAADLALSARRPYWRVKRVLDAVAAFACLVILAPVLFVVAILVAIDSGLPVIFWQQRPGLGNRAFRLYKFRTMAPAHDSSGRPVSEDARLSAIGRFLRRTHLDELPQLYNILEGEMSFVGPRPLLRSEQSPAHAARLLVRPGLTGWAQIKGGRMISVADKAALDIWYVRHASFWLDIGILARTVPLLLLGERVNAAAVREAWRELRRAGLSPDLLAGPTGLAPRGLGGGDAQG